MSTPTAYPLQWPVAWPKTEHYSRKKHPLFKTTVSAALARLQKEVKLLGGSNLILSSNYTLGAHNPKEPGVVAYFVYDKVNVAVPCDRWSIIEHNVLAIAKTIEAMRGMERWGAKHMIKAMFTGFKQLPQQTTGRSWWDVLEYPAHPTDRQLLLQHLPERYRALAMKHHPDRGGSNDSMVALNQAVEEAKAWANGQ